MCRPGPDVSVPWQNYTRDVRDKNLRVGGLPVNAERLHAIAIAIREDLATTSALLTLGQLRDAIQSQVSSPAEPSYQAQVATSLEALLGALAFAPSNTFPPTWTQVVEELGVDSSESASLPGFVRSLSETRLRLRSLLLNWGRCTAKSRL